MIVRLYPVAWMELSTSGIHIVERELVRVSSSLAVTVVSPSPLTVKQYTLLDLIKPSKR